MIKEKITRTVVDGVAIAVVEIGALWKQTFLHIWLISTFKIHGYTGSVNYDKGDPYSLQLKDNFEMWDSHEGSV